MTCCLSKDGSALQTRNDFLVTLCVNVCGHGVLAFGDLAGDFDLLAYVQVPLLDGTAYVDAGELVTKVGFLLQNSDGVVLDGKEELGSGLNIL